MDRFSFEDIILDSISKVLFLCQKILNFQDETGHDVSVRNYRRLLVIIPQNVIRAYFM